VDWIAAVSLPLLVGSLSGTISGCYIRGRNFEEEISHELVYIVDSLMSIKLIPIS
jgi:hypothetical protein